MKLFLSSLAISLEQAPAFIKLVGKDPSDIKIGVIENAADVEDGDTSWVATNREAIKAHGFQMETIDLNEYLGRPDGLREVIEANDVIWLGGGNTLYLRWILKRTTADIIIKELVAKGLVYGGGSAGALVAGPTLKHLELTDDATKVEEHITEGLGLIDVVPVPHWGNEKFGSVVAAIQKELEDDNFKTVHITDDQALVIDGDTQTIVP